MTLEIKLKAGFFKTHGYTLTIGHRQIFLTPHDAGNEKFIINDNELITICIYKRSWQIVELEIITNSRVYTGTFPLRKNLEEVCQTLVKEFGNKFCYQ